MATLPNDYARRQAPQDRGQFVPAYGGSATGEALQGVAGQLGKVADEYQHNQDIAAISTARRALDDWERMALFDPEQGAINKRGKDAEGVPKQLQSSFDEAAGGVMEGLSANQRRAFQEVANGRRGQVLDWAAKHATKERDSYEEGAYQADVKSFVDRAALFPDKAPAELALLGQRTIGYLRSKGRSTEEINAALRDNIDKAHIGVVSSLLNANDDAGAQAYYDRNRASMSADVGARIGQEVKARATLLKAQANADTLTASGMPQAEAIAETRKKFAGQDEEAAVSQLKTRYAEVETAKLQQARQVSNSAWSVLMEKGSMSAIPAQTMAALRTQAPEEERQMRDWLQSKADQARARAKGTFEADDNLYIGLRRMAWEEPAKFQAFVDGKGIERSAPKLADGQVNALLNVAQGMQRQDAKAMETNRVVASTVKAMDAQIRGAGLKINAKPDSAQAKEYAKFQTALTDALEAKMADVKRPLTDPEAREIAAGMLRQGIEQGSGIFGMFQTKRKGHEIATDPALAGKTFIAKPFGQIPAAARDELMKTVRDKEGGRGPRGSLSDEQQALVEKMYQAGIESGRYK